MYTDAEETNVKSHPKKTEWDSKNTLFSLPPSTECSQMKFTHKIPLISFEDLCLQYNGERCWSVLLTFSLTSY